MNLSYKINFPWGPLTLFPEKILAEIKIHSMRKDPHDRWKAGMKIHHATGVRTKNYRCFLEDVCTGTQKIEISHYHLFGVPCIQILIDGRLFYKKDNVNKNETDRHRMKVLARNDGFDSIEDFFKWFDTDFSGKIIHWTDFRY
jgi:hypothetical protein